MFGLGKDAQLPQFFVQLFHEGLHARLDDAKVMVFHFLSFRHLGAEQGTAAVNQVAAFFPELLVDQEILLFRPDVRDDVFRMDAEQGQHALGRFIQRGDGTQERRLLVQHIARVGAERRRDIQAVVLDEGVRRGVPGGVAAGFEGGAQAAGREARRIGFALDQVLAGKFHDDAPIRRGLDEAFMFFGRDARHRLEPVGVVGAAVFQRPILHGVSHHVGQFAAQRLARRHGPLELLIGFRRQAVLHDPFVKCQAAK